MNQPAKRPDAAMIEHVSFAYGATPVLDDVSVRIPAGEFVALIGPNGGGKTTLLKLMLGLLKSDTGEVLVAGKKPGAEKGLVGYVPQNTNVNNSFPISAYDVVMLGRLAHMRRGSSPSADDKRIVQESLEMMNMWGRRDALIGALSGGQRQRVLIARALALEPEILLLDEPAASVDEAGQYQLYELLHNLHIKGMTIILVSHDVSVVSRHVTAIACVNRALHYHPGNEVTSEMFELAYGIKENCPVEMIAHGVPHRVLAHHCAECRSNGHSHAHAEHAQGGDDD